MGTLFLAVSTFTPQAMTAALFYLIHSTLAGAALFLVADLVVRRRGTDALTEALPPVAQGGLIASLFFAAAIGVAGMPPLSGFLGKLLVLDALRGPGMAVLWGVILLTSLVSIVGMSRAGSVLFWKAHEVPGQTPDVPRELVAFAAVFALLAGLAALTVFAGPVTDWLDGTVAALFDPLAYVDANALPGGE